MGVFCMLNDNPHSDFFTLEIFTENNLLHKFKLKRSFHSIHLYDNFIRNKKINVFYFIHFKKFKL